MKRLLKLPLTLSCIACLAACSDKDNGRSSGTAAPTETITEHASAPAATTAVATTAATTTTVTAVTSAVAEIPETTTRDIQYEVYEYETYYGRPEWHEYTYINMEDIIPPETASYMVECTRTTYTTDSAHCYINYYDDHDNPIIQYFANSNENIDGNMIMGSDIYSYEYNPDGSTAVMYDEILIPGSERTTKAVYEYDDMGRNTVIRHYNQDGIEYLIDEYIYEGDNPDHSKYEQKTYKGGVLKTIYTSEYKLTYNEKGQLISKADGSTYADTFKYDASGNPVRQDTAHSYTLYEYDEQNRLVKEEYFYDGEWNTTNEFKYTVLN